MPTCPAVALAAGFAAALAAGAAPPARADTYQIDPTHTFVHFEVPHFATSTLRGRFGRTAGTVAFSRAGRTGQVEITIDTASVDTGTDALDRHLRGKDFFDTERHPTARFVADRFVFQGDRVAEVAGTLTLRGQTHPLALKAMNFNCYLSPLFKREVCGGDFEATISRSHWGLDWGVQHGFADPVRLLVQVEAVRQ
jgi:polyisoprenoid-binding protein YceI